MLSWMLPDGSKPRQSPTASELFFSFAVCKLRKWSCSSFERQRGHMHASVSRTASRGFVQSIYCTMASSSALTESGSPVRNRSSTFTAQNLRGTCKVVYSSMKLFFNISGLQTRRFRKSTGASLGKWVALCCNDYLALRGRALRWDVWERIRNWLAPNGYQTRVVKRAVRPHL